MIVMVTIHSQSLLLPYCKVLATVFPPVGVVVLERETTKMVNWVTLTWEGSGRKGDRRGKLVTVVGIEVGGGGEVERR